MQLLVRVVLDERGLVFPIPFVIKSGTPTLVATVVILALFILIAVKKPCLEQTWEKVELDRESTGKMWEKFRLTLVHFAISPRNNHV